MIPTHLKALSFAIAWTVMQAMNALASTDSSVVPTFSAEHGFYTESFDVVVSSQSTSDTIAFTFDGSDPSTSITALRALSPVTIHIDPESTLGERGKSPGVVLRACSISVDHTNSATFTQTYLFVDKAGLLSPNGVKPGPNWPDPPTASNAQAVHYGMDSTVLNNSRYKDSIAAALLAIPSVSLVTDLKNLFAQDSGIYVNAYQDGIAWERPASIELLNPDGTKGFQINAGIRIRGGASRSGGNPKHAFRFFFRSEYGKGKLDYPLFGNEGVAKFDKVDLRTGENYAWSFPDHLGQYNTMMSDVFCRDLQREMGEPYTRSRAYHLYINGVYWGLYQTEERPEANYAASYFGGTSDDYDVVKTDDSWPSSLQATDGTLDSFQQVWNFCTAGFSSPENYFKLQGLNPNGTRNPGYKNYVDIDNLIDYMLDIFYTGNFDCPTTGFNNNKSPRNFFAIYDRNSNDGFKFIVHDAEHTLRTTAGEGPGIGLNENRVNIGDLPAGDGNRMVVTSFSMFQPQWLHYCLSASDEYRMRFADHVYKHFFNGGCMVPEKAIPLFVSRANEIAAAIIAESARWGDTYLNPVATKDNDWLPAVNDIVQNYFPRRMNIVLNQLKSANLFPAVNPPSFRNVGQDVLTNSVHVQSGYTLTIVNTYNTAGRTILYTIDGEDPRTIGGGIAASAINGANNADVTVTTSEIVRARIKDDTVWSALHEITIFADPSNTGVGSSTAEIPAGFMLSQNFPNPFNPETEIRYSLKSNGMVRLSVFDVLGREIAVLANGVQKAGFHSALFNGAELSSGIYFYRLQSTAGVLTKRMALIK